MSEEKQREKQKAYEKYVKKITPVHNLPLNMLKAFLTGGLISVILTGLNVYSKIGKFGGAGGLVPITGFANSVAASAIEYRAEGQVFGIGCKIFTIAGPVILYGILSSWLLGLIYYVYKLLEVI